MIKNNILQHSSPEYWEESYKAGNTKWDLGSYTPVFNNWFNKIKDSKSICILGAGNGWDAINIAQKGHFVTAVDFAMFPINKIKYEAKKNAVKMEILHLDIFKLPQYFNNYFDIVIEYTCFCAIDPKTRVNYIKMVKDILKPRGKFIGLLFPLDLNTNADGPPFHIDLNKTLLLFDEYLIQKQCEKSALSIESRKDREMFFIYQKDENEN